MEVDDQIGQCAEDSDPVVAEYPVYWNRLENSAELSGEVFVMLNTLRPKYRPYGDQGSLTSVELSENDNALRLTYALDQQATTYDSSAVHALEEQSLIARPIPRDSGSASHCMGILHDGILHLVPVSTTCSVRPDFHHVDTEQAVRKGMVQGVKDEASTTAPSGAAVAKPQLSGKALYYHQLVSSLKGGPVGSSNASTTWRSIDFYDEDSVETADLVNEGIFIDKETLSLPDCRYLHFSCSQEDYLRRLAGGHWGDGNGPLAATSSQLSRMDFGKQIETILKRNNMIRFEDVLNQIPPNSRAKYTELEIIDQLENYSICVHGNWIVYSHLTEHRPQLWDTRDALILLMQAANRDISVQLLSSINGLGKDDIEEILKPLCLLDILSHTWKSKLKPDENFVKNYPEVMKRQETASRNLVNRLKAKKDGGQQSGTASVSGNVKHTSLFSSEELGQVAQKVEASLIASGTMTTDELRHFTQSICKQHFISASVVLELLKTIGAIPVRDRWVSSSIYKRESCSALNELRAVLIQLFRHKDALSKPEISEAFRNRPDQVCNTNITDHDLRRVIKEFANNDKGMWVFKGEPIAERKIMKKEDQLF